MVARTFKEYPVAFRKKLLAVRKLILAVAKSSSAIGELDEALKWGEPSYLPKEKNIGTTIRIHWLKSKPHQYGIYFNCQTTLIADFKKKYAGQFKYEGKRAIILNETDSLPVEQLKGCILMALTYHKKTK